MEGRHSGSTPIWQKWRFRFGALVLLVSGGIVVVYGPVFTAPFLLSYSLGVSLVLLALAWGADYLIEVHRRAQEQMARMEASLRESETRYDLALRASNGGLWDWDLVANRIHFGTRWLELLGFENVEVGTTPDVWFQRIHPDDQSQVQEKIQFHLKEQTAVFRSAHRLRLKKGVYRWFLCRGIAERNSEGVPVRMAGSHLDITEQREMEQELRNRILYDALSGLPNRTLFMDRLKRALGHSKKRSNYSFAVLYMDICRFTTLQNTLGHGSAHQLISSVAHKLSTIVRPGDTVARLERDVFVVLLDDSVGAESPSATANRIQNELRKPIHLNNDEVMLEVSIGVVSAPDNYSNAEEILRDAETALIRSKAKGRGRIEIFRRYMRSSGVNRYQREIDLRHAIERNELRVVFQPIIALRDSRVMGFEALVRWFRNGQGMLLPGQFIPLAEESGMITSVDEWVLRHGCAQIRDWQERGLGNFSLSVNLSGADFTNVDVPDLVRHTLTDIGLKPEHLRLELTETVLVDQAEEVSTLMELRRSNVGLSLDDFGTGFSSLSYLSRLPVDMLKIDRSFVQATEKDPTNWVILESMISLAHGLGLQVVAEGIETSAQHQRLVGLGCDYGQGYFFSPPVDARGAEQFLAA